jgi:hypothetical protein
VGGGRKGEGGIPGNAPLISGATLHQDFIQPSCLGEKQLEAVKRKKKRLKIWWTYSVMASWTRFQCTFFSSFLRLLCFQLQGRDTTEQQMEFSIGRSHILRNVLLDLLSYLLELTVKFFLVETSWHIRVILNVTLSSPNPLFQWYPQSNEFFGVKSQYEMLKLGI